MLFAKHEKEARVADVKCGCCYVVFDLLEW